jgi:hypothetical protein
MTGVVTPTELKEVAGPLAELLADLDPDYITPREAPALWEALESVRRQVTGAQVVLAQRVDESTVAKDAGLRNGAEWIAKASGSSLSAGYEQMAASKRLVKLPLVAAAVRRGDISVPQAQTIADAATCDPTAEERLLGLAGVMSLSELRTECGRTKAAADPDAEARYKRIHRERRLRRYRNDDGAWCLSGRGTIDAGAEFSIVLDAIGDEIFRNAYESGARESRDAYLFDALMEMGRRAWHYAHHTPHESKTDGDADAPKPPTKPRRKQGVNPRYRALLRIDVPALVRGHVEGEETCDIPGWGSVPVSVARDLLGDALLHVVLTHGKQVINVTTSARAPNLPQRLALLWNGLQCSRLGCPHLATEIDHRKPVADGGPTNIANIDGLCSHDHDLKTRFGWALLPGTGKREMVPPTDPRHPGNPTFHKKRQPKGETTTAPVP